MVVNLYSPVSYLMHKEGLYFMILSELGQKEVSDSLTHCKIII